MDIAFFLKKLVAYFVEPFGMIFALFIIGIFFLFRNKSFYSKTFLFLAFFLLSLYSYPPFSNYLVSNLENKYQKYDYTSDVKYIHVLGSGHNVDPEQPLSSQLGSASVKRDLEGILIHLKTPESILIFTGYGGTTNTPTAVMNAKLAFALGIKEENILINGLPKDTREEAIYTKSIVGDAPFLLVTSATHMPRSMMLFKSLGLNPIAAPTNFYKTNEEDYFKFNLESLQRSQIAMHEYLGIIWAKIRG